jgi:putative transposase
VDLAARRWSHAPSPFGGKATGPTPTDRGTGGTKRRVLTEGQGLPLAGVVAGAHRHDMKRLADTLNAGVGPRPAPPEEAPQQVCLDKGDDDDACRHVAEPHDDIPPMRARGEEPREKREIPGYRPRRWVVAVCHAWLNRVRTILVRFEKKLETPLALLQLACADIVLKRAEVFR